MPTVGVYIGRFQPFHNGHLKVLNSALSKFDRVVVVLGSHNTLRTPKNPWTAEEREVMISRAVNNPRLRFIYQEDRGGNNEKWAQEIQEKVKLLCWEDDQEFFITGCDKDASSFYVHIFKDWKTSLVPLEDRISSTDIRDEYFTSYPDSSWEKWGDDLPASSYMFLLRFKETTLYKELRKIGV